MLTTKRVERGLRYYIDSKRVTIIAKPSAAHAEKQTEDENKRIEEQKERLGSEKLKELEKELQKHRNQNDISVPAEVVGRIQMVLAHKDEYLYEP